MGYLFLFHTMPIAYYSGSIKGSKDCFQFKKRRKKAKL